MNPVSSLQAAIMGIITEAGAVAVGYGLVSNQQVGLIVSLAGAIVVAAFLVANSVHAHAAAKVTAAKIAAAPVPAPLAAAK